jgi:hypothetical protein
MVSVPYAVMECACPAAHTASHTAAPKSAGTFTSKPSSPVKLTRKSRIGTPQMWPAATPMCGSDAALRSMSTRPASTWRALGPCTAITAHCSVVEVSQTASSDHSV